MWLKVLVSIVVAVIIFAAAGPLISRLLEFVVDGTAHLILSNVLTLLGAVGGGIGVFGIMQRSSK